MIRLIELNTKAVVCILLVLIEFLLAAKSQGQGISNTKAASKATSQDKDKNAKRPPPRDFKTKALDRAPTLARLPQYPGKNALLVKATDLQNTQKGHLYTLKYEVKEDFATTADWYKKALENYGWQIKYTAKKKDMLIAINPENGLRCIVKMRQSRRPGYRSRLTLRYIETPTLEPAGGAKKNVKTSSSQSSKTN